MTKAQDPPRKMMHTMEAKLDPRDLQILVRHRYGDYKTLRESCLLRQEPADLASRVAQLPEDIEDFSWMAVLKNERPFDAAGKINIEFYRKTLAYLTAKAVRHWEETNEKLDVASTVKSLLDTAKAYGFDLTQEEERAATDWLKNRDLLENTEENLLAIWRELRKIRPRDEKEAALKKKWKSLVGLVLRMQRWGKRNPMAAWTLIGRDQQDGRVFSWQPIHLEMAEVIMGDTWYWIIVPSGHGKTNLELGLKAMKLGMNPNLRACQVLHGMDVIQRVQYIRTIVESARYRALFPNVRIDRGRSDAATQFSIKRVSASVDPSMQGKGLLQTVEGIHPNDIHVDDPHGREVAYSDPDRERDLRAFQESWLKRVTVHDQFGGSGTRWHDMDCHGYVIRRHQTALERGGDALETAFAKMKIYIKAVPHTVGEDGRIHVTGSLWGDRFPVSLLQEEADDNPQQWMRDRGCNPTHKGSGAVGNVKYYCPYSHDSRKPQFLDTWLSVDPAIGVQRASDFSGWVKIARGLDKFGKRRLFVLEAGMEKKRPTQLGEFIRQMFEQKNVDYCLMETRGPAGSCLPDICEALGPFKHRLVGWEGMAMDKSSRLKGVSMLLEQGAILWPGHQVQDGQRWEPQGQIAWLINNILRFGSVVHPDGVDAVTQFLFHQRPWLQFKSGPAEEAETARTREEQIFEDMKASLDTDGGEPGTAENEFAFLEV